MNYESWSESLFGYLTHKKSFVNSIIVITLLKQELLR